MPIRVLAVNRIGQISGTTTTWFPNPPAPGDKERWPLLVDAVGNPLLTDTGKWWNVEGLDEGANAEHSDGRLYFFFGDVATDQRRPPPLNADLVAWTDEPAPLRHGGHLAMGWNFQLPITGPGIEGQPDWQFCLKCSALFWNGDPNFKGRCSLGGSHDTFGVGLNFSLPHEPTAIAGQDLWRFCGKCGSLFWKGDPNTTGVCPAGGTHVDPEGSWHFVVPVMPGSQGGQSDWRFCGSCHGLFFDGYPTKGVCVGSPGGGFHLRAVLQNGPHLAMGGNFTVPITHGQEGQRDWQFCLKCSALFFNGDPNFKGRCNRDGSHDTFNLGLNFTLPFEPTGISGQHQWHFCGKCASLFWWARENDPSTTGICPAGGLHVAGDHRFVIPVTPAPIDGQPDWRFCAKCHGLFWDGDEAWKGNCCGSPNAGPFDEFRGPEPIGYTGSSETPGGAFSYEGRMYVLAGFTYEQYRARRRSGDPQPGQYLFSKADPSRPGRYDTEFMLSPKLGWCARDASRDVFESHLPMGWQFLLTHDVGPAANRRSGWRSCAKCEAVFFNGAAFKGVCQRDGGPHEPDRAVADDFSLEIGSMEDRQNQTNWQQCFKCMALYWAVDADAGLVRPAITTPRPVRCSGSPTPVWSGMRSGSPTGGSVTSAARCSSMATAWHSGMAKAPGSARTTAACTSPRGSISRFRSPRGPLTNRTSTGGSAANVRACSSSVTPECARRIARRTRVPAGSSRRRMMWRNSWNGRRIGGNAATARPCSSTVLRTRVTARPLVAVTNPVPAAV